MSFSDIAKPRRQILSGEGVEGIVDLENLRDPRKSRIEAKPDDFFDLTYPSSDIRFVLQNLNERFCKSTRTEGLFLFEGYKGSGKSHLLLFIHHLANSQDAGQRWLKRHGLECRLPENPIVITHKFTDFPLDELWNLIWTQCDAGKWKHDHPPNLDELRTVTAGKKLFLILDELERGIESIPNPARKMQNLNFLQMLSEESQRDEDATVTLFASIYDSAHEPGSTLKRVPRVDVKFSDPEDRTRIVLHRLFENADALDRRQVESVITSFRNDWKRKGIPARDDYLHQLERTYPFSPELIQLVQEQARDQFQGTRGALGLLGALTKLAYRKLDLITAASASIRDRSILNRLIDLDPGQKIIGCARNDLDDLRDLPFAEELVAAVLLATLAASGKAKGMNEETIARQVLKPGDDVNVFRSTLQAFHKLGTFFHEQEGIYYFDPEEKPSAKVEYKSLGIDAKEAINRVFEFWAGEWFGDRDAVVFRDVDQAKAELRLRDSRRPRYVLAPRRLAPDERHNLYFGVENRNLVILLEPRNKEFNALNHPDILKWAQRYLAATDLQNSASGVERKRQFEKIAAEDKSYLQKSFKNAGFAYSLVEDYGEKPTDDRVELEPLASTFSQREVAEYIGKNFFPQQRFEEHLRERLGSVLGKRLKTVERLYQETLGYPVPIYGHWLRDAIIQLCRNREIGLHHEKDNACGRRPALSDLELCDAVLAEPFEDTNTAAALDLRERRQPSVGSSLSQPMPMESESTAATTVAAIASFAQLVSLETPFSRSLGELRQEVAAKLTQHEYGRIVQVVFRIFFEKRNADLSSLPSSLRGSLSGVGDLTADVTLTRSGTFNKSEVEQMVECLPVLPGGDYKAEMKIQVEEPEPASSESDR